MAFSFGAPTATAAPTFGAPAPAAGGFSFGAATAAPAGGGFFGGAAAGQKPATGLFGAPAAAPAAGLFGAPAAAPAGGLFGAPAAAPAGGLFGAPAAAPAAGGFAIGAPKPAGTGLFGGTTAPAPAGGLFGATPAPAYGAPSAGGGLFGGAAGGGLFGQQPAYGQPQQMVAAPATQPATRFEQLPATPATLGRDGVLAVEKHLAQNRTLQKRVALAAQPVREGMAHLREAVAAARGALERAAHEQRRPLSLIHI